MFVTTGAMLLVHLDLWVVLTKVEALDYCNIVETCAVALPNEILLVSQTSLRNTVSSVIAFSIGVTTGVRKLTRAGCAPENFNLLQSDVNF